MGDHRAAVVLLSGGMDSATAAAIARADGFSILALTISYGQRHSVEITAARRVAESLGVAEHVVSPLDLRVFGGSALTDQIDVPKGRSADAMQRGIPVTYVPARNTILLSLALAFAESRGARHVFVGVNAVDFSGYPDCRPEFIEVFERVANLGTKAGVEGEPFRIHAPLIAMSKSQIIHEGTRLGVDFGLTHSCYDPSVEGRACGHCDSCILRRRGFEEACLCDPTQYVSE